MSSQKRLTKWNPISKSLSMKVLLESAFSKLYITLQMSINDMLSLSSYSTSMSISLFGVSSPREIVKEP